MKKILFSIVALLLFTNFCFATVSSTTDPTITYNGNDATVSFPVPFGFIDDTDLVVIHTDGDGSQTTWTKDAAGDSGYTVSGSTVTANTAPSSGTTLTIYRAIPMTQGLDLQQGRKYNPNLLEDALDRLTYIAQDIESLADASVQQSAAAASATSAAASAAEAAVYAEQVGANEYYPDYSEADQGVTATGNGITIYDAVQAIGSKKGTIVLIHNKSNTKTEYNLDTNLDLSSKPDIQIIFRNGALLKQVTGDETITFYSASNLVFQNGQSIGDIDIFMFDEERPKYGRVEVFPWISGSVSNVRAATGLWADVSSSTTDGLQEAIDLAFGDGTKGNATYNLHINGREEWDSVEYALGGAVVFETTTTIDVPPLQGAVWTSDAVSITSATAAPVLQFDSMMMANIDLRGVQVVGSGNGPVVLFEPNNGVPIDDLQSIIDSSVYITTIAASTPSGGTSEAALEFNCPAAGTIVSSTFEFDEINAGSQYRGVNIITTGSGAFSESHFKCLHIHDANLIGMYLGYSRANIFELALHGISAGSSTGLDSYGTENQIYITPRSAGFTTLLDMNSGSDYNTILLPVTSETMINVGNDNKLITTMDSNRGDPSSVDYSVGNFTTDGAWHDLDLSSIVPVFARFVEFSIIYQHASTGQNFLLRKNGHSNTVDTSGILTQISGQLDREELRVACDVNRVVEYFATSGTWTTIDLTVIGWEY